MTTEKPKRGGKRPGAGAPRGNINAARTGRHMANRVVRRGLLRIPPEEREEFLRELRSEKGIELRNRRTRDAAPQPPPPNLIPLPTASAAAEEQSNPAIMDTAARLTMHGFFGALPFLRRHFPTAAAVNEVLDHLARLAVEDPEEYAKVRSKGAFIRAMFHELTASIHDELLYCRFCDWNQPRLFNPKEETG